MTNWRVPLGRPWITDVDDCAVLAALRRPQLSSGPACAELEKAVAEYVGRPHAVATNSGTSALWAILKAYGVRGEVICPSFTFSATANAIVAAGAAPVFADIELRTCGLDMASVDMAVTERTEAVVLVHFAGMTAHDSRMIQRECRKRRLLLIEDCAEALGSKHTKRDIRAGGWGNAAMFSFFPTKNITCGEGGMAVFTDGSACDRARRWIAHGIQREADKPWKRNAVLPGMNLRLSDILASLALSQFERLMEMNEQRRQIAIRYDAAFADMDNVKPLWPAEKWLGNSYMMYTLFYGGGLPTKFKRVRRDAFVNAIRAQGVEASVHFDPPVHQQTYHASRGERVLAHTEAVSASIVTLPMFPDMTDEEVDIVVQAARKADAK